MEIMLTYLIIGIALSCYWWNKTYRKDYEKSKASEEGVEEGMAVNHLLFMVIFWPIILACNLYLYKRI